MSKKVYVGNLPFQANDDNLNAIFSQIGTVESARVITNKFTGRSKGYGFVEMSKEEEALDAIARFNGVDYEGRPMTVSAANPPQEREEGAQGGRGGRFNNRNNRRPGGKGGRAPAPRRNDAQANGESLQTADADAQVGNTEQESSDQSAQAVSEAQTETTE